MNLMHFKLKYKIPPKQKNTQSRKMPFATFSGLQHSSMKNCRFFETISVICCWDGCLSYSDIPSPLSPCGTSACSVNLSFGFAVFLSFDPLPIWSIVAEASSKSPLATFSEMSLRICSEIYVQDRSHADKCCWAV